MLKVAVVMGAPDAAKMEPAMEILERFGVPFEVRVISAHRTPDEAREYARAARERGVGVMIAGAGLAAHLAGAIAANTTLPVIGVPLQAGPLAGVDALCSTVMMPTGYPVATVAIGGSANAALLAIQILSLGQPDLEERVRNYRAELARKAAEADRELQSAYAEHTQDES